MTELADCWPLGDERVVIYCNHVRDSVVCEAVGLLEEPIAFWRAKLGV